MGTSNSFGLRIHLLLNKGPFPTIGEMSQCDNMTWQVANKEK